MLSAIIDSVTPHDTNPHRHLGPSQLGKPCARAIWAELRGLVDPPSPRIRRLFDRGKREEAVVVRALEAAGMTVEHCLDDQLRLELSPWIFGSPDGIVHGLPGDPQTPYLLEIKTHSQYSFQTLRKSGVQEAKLEHYIQMQLYMYALGLDRALYYAVNKNDDSIYTETLWASPGTAESAIRRGMDIVMSDTPPACSPGSYCKWCSVSRRICPDGHGESFIVPSCRSCRHGAMRINDDDKGIIMCLAPGQGGEIDEESWTLEDCMSYHCIGGGQTW